MWLALPVIGLLGGPCTASLASIQEAIAPHGIHGTHGAHVHGAEHAHTHGQAADHHRSKLDECCYALKATVGAGASNPKPESPTFVDMVSAPVLGPLVAVPVRTILRAIEPALRHQTSPPIYLATQRFRD